MRYEGRFVVETHAHITTRYRPNLQDPKTRELAEKGIFHGLNGVVETYDNSAFCLYEMERYGVDMCLLLPSVLGTTNEMQAELVDRYPDKFRACCSHQATDLKVWRGELKWSAEAACEEIDAALSTGKYVGIGEGVSAYLPLWGGKVCTYMERLDEWRQFMAVAAKHNVPIYFHEHSFPWGFSWDPWDLLHRLAGEYPDVVIVVPHGGYDYVSPEISEQGIAKACQIIAHGAKNVYVEAGNWPAEYFKIPMNNPNVGISQLMWGGEYGDIIRLFMTRDGRPTDLGMVKTSFQTDWWGWGLNQIQKLRTWGWLTQDEINLLLGGNAVKVFKFPAPHERMFPNAQEIHDILGPASGAY